MKNRRGIWAVLLSFVAAAAYADVIVTQPTPVAVPNTTVVVPQTTPAVVTPPATQVTDLDRQGDWYVVYGPADLDRYHTLIRIKDEKHGSLVTIPYHDGVEIYRHGQRISYSDVNEGDNVTVRFKNS